MGACTGKLKKNGSSCDDKNPCTSKDVCTAGACAGTKKRDGTDCELDDDDNECVSEDGTCRAGTCKPDKAKTCAAPDQCHVGLCDPKTGGCFSRDASAGTACNDGNACTSADQCANGVCTGTPACDNDDSSAPPTRATDGRLRERTGERATTRATRRTGACTGRSTATTTTPAAATRATSSSGACTSARATTRAGAPPTGVTGDRLLPCAGTVRLTTATGAPPRGADPAAGCVRQLIFCDDDNACTADSCDPSSGCVYTVVSCDDNNACTTD